MHRRKAAHPREAGSAHLVTQVPTAGPEQTVAEALEAIRATSYDVANSLYLVDGEQRLHGIVPLRRLLIAPAETALKHLMLPTVPVAHPDEDQESIAHTALKYDLGEVPVVSERGAFLGVVPDRALLNVLYHEHVEDLRRLVGITHSERQARRAIEAPPARRARDRLPWLLAGLLGSVVATCVVAGFHASIESNLALAFFVPGIVYLADAIGTQTEAITVRGLSISHAPLGRLLRQELGTGFLIGGALAALVFPLVLFAFNDARLALTVSAALVGASALATSVGLLFPWLLSRFGSDPAFGSGPIATVVQDVISLLIYFWTALWVMG